MPKRSRVVTIRRMPPRALTGKQKKELSALAALPDEQIDTSDIPELPPRAWKDAVRGRFYRPVKQAVSIRLDADVVAWLKKRGKGYQTRANRILRQQMLADMKRAWSEWDVRQPPRLFRVARTLLSANAGERILLSGDIAGVPCSCLSRIWRDRARNVHPSLRFRQPSSYPLGMPLIACSSASKSSCRSSVVGGTRRMS